MKKAPSKSASSGVDDKKLQTALKKMNVQPIQAIEEVNMFKEDGNVIHFAAPKGGPSPPSRQLLINIPTRSPRLRTLQHIRDLWQRRR